MEEGRGGGLKEQRKRKRGEDSMRRNKRIVKGEENKCKESKMILCKSEEKNRKW